MMRAMFMMVLLVASGQALAEEWRPFVDPVAAANSASQIDQDSVRYPDSHVVDYWIRTKPANQPDDPKSFVLRHTIVDCDTRKVHFSTVSEYQGDVLAQHIDVTPAVVYAPGIPAGDYFNYCKRFYEIWK